MDTLKQKLHPGRFPGMSPMMAAVVGFVLGESFTNPEIAEINASEAENLVYFRKSGSVCFDGLQSLVDLRQNWNRLIDVAGLKDEERGEAVRLFVFKVEKVPGTEMWVWNWFDLTPAGLTTLKCRIERGLKRVDTIPRQILRKRAASSPCRQRR